MSNYDPQLGGSLPVTTGQEPRISPTCPKCGRKRFHVDDHERWCGYDLAQCKAYVVHEPYGCDTGCCGHQGYLIDGTGNVVDWTGFEFSHPYSNKESDRRIFAEAMVDRWQGAVLDWERCEIYDD